MTYLKDCYRKARNMLKKNKVLCKRVV